MAYTYTTTPFDNIARVRLMIDDHPTPITGAHFTDEEITEFLTMATGSLLTAAAYALEAWAASLTESAESEKIGDYAYTKKQAANKLALAERYRNAEAEEPALTWAEMNLTGESE